MRILITGICGFVGSTLAKSLLDEHSSGLTITGLDNLSRAGSWINWEPLQKRGVRLLHGDVRLATDLERVGAVDWVIDAAANPSVLAGVEGQGSSRQLLEHNLGGTINLLEFCKERRAGFTLLSTSRVYSIHPLSELKVAARNNAFEPVEGQQWPHGLSAAGISESFAVRPPISLYGASKLASETLALEYGSDFNFPVWINRCGVLAGAGQFGKPDQGIFAFWINAWLRGQPLRYIGFGGTGHQVRDCLHPRDLAATLVQQTVTATNAAPQVCNFGGGRENTLSLAQLSAWCIDRFGSREVASEPKPRPFDIPWMVLDCAAAEKIWGWKPQTPIRSVLDEIATHAEAHPEWLRLSGADAGRL